MSVLPIQPPVLGIDLGIHNTGFAVTDPLGITARPLEIWPTGTRDETIQHILSLARENQASMLAIGYPKTKDDAPTAIGQRVCGLVPILIEELSQSSLAVPVVLIDESSSSEEAKMMMIHHGTNRKARKKDDAWAAAVIAMRGLDLLWHLPYAVEQNGVRFT